MLDEYSLELRGPESCFLAIRRVLKPVILRLWPYFAFELALYFGVNASIMKSCNWFRLKPLGGLSGFVRSKSVADVPVGERPTFFLGTGLIFAGFSRCHAGGWISPADPDAC